VRVTVINKLNRIGPNTDPCGTPFFTRRSYDAHLLEGHCMGYVYVCGALS